MAGKRAPAEANGVLPVAVRVTKGGARAKGTLAMSFADARHGIGELSVAGCRLYFEAHR